MADGKQTVVGFQDYLRSSDAASLSVDRESDVSSVLETLDLEWMFKRGAFGETVTGGCPSHSPELHNEDLIVPELEERGGYFSGGRTRKDTHWSVPWSDLMMTMFVFFAVLYMFHRSKEKAYSDEPRPRYVPPAIVTQAVERSSTERLGGLATGLTRIYDLSRETVRAKALEEFASVTLTPDEAVSIILKGDLLFDSGKAELWPEAKESLGEIAGILKQTPHVVNLVGHTDDVPMHSDRFPTNWELSAARACAVARYLTDEMGLPSSRFFVTGHGEQQPVRPNDSDENRALNRRVEIIITKEKPHAEAGSLATVQGQG